MKKKILFIINPIAGIRSKKSITALIDKIIDKTQFDSEIKFSEYAGHATIIAREAANRKTDIVVSVGGDGTVNEVAGQLVHTTTALAIIPLGSGNGLARHLRIPLNIKKAIQVINSGKIIQMDAGFANGKYFFSAAGVGFDAHIAREYAKRNQRGFWSYFKTIVREIFSYKCRKYLLKIDDRQIHAEAFLIAFGNSSQYGYDFFIAPHADVRDGYVDVCIIRQFPKWLLPLLVLLILLRKHQWAPYISIYKSQTVHLQTENLEVINLDGEAIPAANQVDILVKPLSLNILVPNS